MKDKRTSVNLKLLLSALYLTLCCLSFVAISFCNELGKENTTITLVSYESPPLSSNKIINNGTLSEIITKAFAEVGINISIIYLPWQRAKVMLQDGLVWGMYPAFSTPDRVEKFLFSESVAKTKSYFYYYGEPQHYNFTNLQDLRGYLLGGTQGYFYTEIFEKAKLNVQYTTTDINNLHKLARKRIDFFLLNEHSAKTLIEENFANEKFMFKRIEELPFESEFRIMVSKKFHNGQEILQKFNFGISKLKEKEFYQILIDKLKQHSF